MSKRQERQRFIRHYKEETGATEIDMHEVAKFAQRMGWKMPTPPTAVDLLAKQFAEDAQAERKHDEKTGKPFGCAQAACRRAVQSGICWRLGGSLLYSPLRKWLR